VSLLDVNDEPILIRAVGEVEDALLVKRKSALVASLDSHQSKLYKGQRNVKRNTYKNFQITIFKKIPWVDLESSQLVTETVMLIWRGLSV